MNIPKMARFSHFLLQCDILMLRHNKKIFRPVDKFEVSGKTAVYSRCNAHLIWVKSVVMGVRSTI